MQQGLSKEERELLTGLRYFAGSAEIIENMPDLPAKAPFSDEIIAFLNDVSKVLMSSRQAKGFPDVITLGFWLRKASLQKIKEQFCDEKNIRLGRGTAFHIAPSNVPVNYAYSLVSGLLTGNANVVRIPSKDFPQVEIINDAINAALDSYPEIKPYIALIRYDRSAEITDLLSGLCDMRIVWGGDDTIAELRKSPLKPRAGEITFADRYSLAAIDSDAYLAEKNKERIAEDFYNDTFLTDQNACTSPRMVVWLGSRKEEAKQAFWTELHKLVKAKYQFQTIQGINKLTSAYLLSAELPGVKIEPHEDNLIVRVNVPVCNVELMNFKDNSGYFFEYDCKDVLELRNLCDNTHCQTLSYLGDKEQFKELLLSGIKGVDRIVPIGHTMDFELIWDGYDLTERLTRIIKIN